ncbi:MAG: sialate O-acetylesterase [Prevotellaceae bacterium]|jgi:hypothetical protein|nr:sialate O-acetylesterase [Prevotellaceae bacterium]
MMKRLVRYCLFIALSLGAGHVYPATAGHDTLDIYLCIGQSNMAGRGIITDAYRDTLKHVYLLNGEGAMEAACHPLNRYSSIRKEPGMQKVGPAYSFAEALTGRTGRAIGLVVNARGGSSINAWLKGADEGYYDEALSRLRQALKFGKLRGIIWHQGEADSKYPESYMAKLQQLVSDLRTDLGDPSLPFVVGELARWLPASPAFNRMLRKVSRYIPYTACVSARGLTPLIDKTDPHFDAASQEKLGKRYATVLTNVQSLRATAR